MQSTDFLKYNLLDIPRDIKHFTHEDRAGLVNSYWQSLLVEPIITRYFSVADERVNIERTSGLGLQLLAANQPLFARDAAYIVGDSLENGSPLKTNFFLSSPDDNEIKLHLLAATIAAEWQLLLVADEKTHLSVTACSPLLSAIEKDEITAMFYWLAFNLSRLFAIVLEESTQTVRRTLEINTLAHRQEIMTPLTQVEIELELQNSLIADIIRQSSSHCISDAHLACWVSAVNLSRAFGPILWLLKNSYGLSIHDPVWLLAGVNAHQSAEFALVQTALMSNQKING